MKPARQCTPKARSCRGCPYRAPKGRCLDPVIKSGRCGLYVWYVRGGKQCRRRWAKPKDPRTPKQRHWRARLGAASRKYSHALTDKQQDACIAAGAKRRSRPRLDQSGWLTGQQYLVQRECASKAAGGMRSAEGTVQVPQPQRVTRSTWEPHRGPSRPPPGHSRRDTGRVSKKEGRRKSGEGRRQRVRAASEVLQAQRVTRIRWGHCRNTTGVAVFGPAGSHGRAGGV
jgi:hypothetical protein